MDWCISSFGFFNLLKIFIFYYLIYNLINILLMILLPSVPLVFRSRALKIRLFGHQKVVNRILEDSIALMEIPPPLLEREWVSCMDEPLSCCRNSFVPPVDFLEVVGNKAQQWWSDCLSDLTKRSTLSCVDEDYLSHKVLIVLCSAIPLFAKN